MSPFYSSLKPNSTQSGHFKSALMIAQQPLMALQKIKDGTLTDHDMGVFKNIYPDLYHLTAEKLYHEAIESSHREEMMPYHSRMSLSLFLGKALDSTMTPQSILANQMVNTGQSNDQGDQKPHGFVKPNSKLAQGVATPGQAREAQRSSVKI